MSTVCTVSSLDKFEFLYEYYHNYKYILSCERHRVIYDRRYMIENFMIENHWERHMNEYVFRIMGLENKIEKNKSLSKIT